MYVVVIVPSLAMVADCTVIVQAGSHELNRCRIEIRGEQTPFGDSVDLAGVRWCHQQRQPRPES